MAAEAAAQNRAADYTGCPLWLETAAPGHNFPALQEEIRVDLLVVGGGFTGLLAARRAVELGRTVALVEAHRIGWGASGRMTGQCVPTAPGLPQAAGERERRLCAAVAASATRLREIVENHDLRCDFLQRGAITAAAAAATLARLEDAARAWQPFSRDVAFLDARQLRDHLYTDRYSGGIYFRAAATVNPLAFCRELARVIAGGGGQVFENSPAWRLDPMDGGWRVAAGSGAVKAARVLLASHGRSTLERQAELTEFPLAMVASAPLTHGGGEVCRDGMAINDADRQDLFGVGFDAAGRLVYSVLPRFGRPASPATAAALYQRLLLRVFPQLAGKLDWTHVWYAREPLHKTFRAHLYQYGPGIFGLCGYTGYGLSQALVLADNVADYLLDGNAGALLLPISPPGKGRSVLRDLTLAATAPLLARRAYR